MQQVRQPLSKQSRCCSCGCAAHIFSSLCFREKLLFLGLVCVCFGHHRQKSEPLMSFWIASEALALWRKQKDKSDQVQNPKSPPQKSINTGSSHVEKSVNRKKLPWQPDLWVKMLKTTSSVRLRPGERRRWRCRRSAAASGGLWSGSDPAGSGRSPPQQRGLAPWSAALACHNLTTHTHKRQILLRKEVNVAEFSLCNVTKY